MGRALVISSLTWAAVTVLSPEPSTGVILSQIACTRVGLDRNQAVSEVDLMWLAKLGREMSFVGWRISTSADFYNVPLVSTYYCPSVCGLKIRCLNVRGEFVSFSVLVNKLSFCSWSFSIAVGQLMIVLCILGAIHATIWIMPNNNSVPVSTMHRKTTNKSADVYYNFLTNNNIFFGMGLSFI